MTAKECRVYGALAVILRCCRVVGAAPAKLTPASYGYRASFCKASSVYGYILSFTLIGFALSLDVMALVAVYTNASYEKTNLTHLPQFGSMFVIVMVGTFHAKSRVKNMFGYMSELQEIVNTKGIDRKRERKGAMVTAVIVAAYCALELWDVAAEIISNNSFLTYIDCLCNTKFLMMQFIMIHVICFYIEVYKTLQIISAELRELIDSEYDLDQGKCRLRRVNRQYIIICDVIAKVDQDVGLFCVVAFIYNIITMMDTSSFIAAHLIATSNSEDIYIDWLFLARQGNWIMIEAFRLILFLEPFQKIDNEKTKIKYLVAQLMYRWTGCGQLMCCELEQAVKQLLTVTTDVTPLGLFRYSRALVITTFSIVMTYAIVELQFKIHDFHTIQDHLNHHNNITLNTTISL